MKQNLKKYIFKANKPFYLSLILLFAFISQSQAAVTLNNSTNGRAFDTLTGVASLTFSHSINSGTNRALFVGISTSKANILITPGIASSRIQSVTYAGIALTPIQVTAVPPETAILSPAPNFESAVEFFRLTEQEINPTPLPASGNIVITVRVTAMTSVNYIVGGAITFNNVSQAIPNGGIVSAQNSNDSPQISVDANDGDVVLDVLSTSFNAIDIAPNNLQTLQWLGNFPVGDSGSDVGGGSTKAAPSATSSTVNMNWMLNTARDWAYGGLAIKQVPGNTAASGTIQGRVLTSEGRGIARVIVSITGGNGEVLNTRTNSFGYFRFSEIPFGENYIIQVNSKRYIFAPRIITFNEDMNDFNLFAIEN